MEARLGGEEGDNEMALRHQFDKLRRDVAKNQFASLNEKKNKEKRKGKCQTILEMANDDEEAQLRVDK
jgi:hypothetical protein